MHSWPKIFTFLNKRGDSSGVVNSLLGKNIFPFSPLVYIAEHCSSRRPPIYNRFFPLPPREAVEEKFADREHNPQKDEILSLSPTLHWKFVNTWSYFTHFRDRVCVFIFLHTDKLLRNSLTGMLQAHQKKPVVVEYTHFMLPMLPRA